MEGNANLTPNTETFFANIDWPLFYQEKMAIQEVMGLLAQGEGVKEKNAVEWLDGILNMMDAIGDIAEDAGFFMYPERDENDRCYDDRFNDVLLKRPEDFSSKS